MKTQFLAAVALTAAAMFGLTACGGGDSPSAASSTPPADADRNQKFITCLRQHGMEVPDNPGGGSNGGPQFDAARGSSAQIDAAQAACAKYAPPQSGPDVSEADYDRAVKKAECLREQGINAKDPKSGTTTITVEQGTGDTQEKLVSAYTTCNKKVPDSSK